MERCKNNVNGHCKMFGRRESCEECSEYSCEEENARDKEEEAKDMTLQEAYERMLKKLNEEFL